MKLLTGKTALVTGGARGLGAAIAQRFAREGAVGTVLDLPEVRAQPPAGWGTLAADVRDDQQIERALDRVGELDVVVAAAGVVPQWRGVEALDPEEWDEVFRVNARGLMSTIRHAARALRPGGAVVAIGSLNSWRGDPNLAPYVASKHAVLGLVRSAALDLGRRGIRVNALAPGPIATEALLERMARRERELGLPVDEALAAAALETALGRIATEAEVAAAALFLASELSSGITGHLLPVDCGIR